MSDNVFTDEINEYGTHRWFKNGVLHREGDLPAKIWVNGTQMWYKEGKEHRDGDLPAAIGTNGTQVWYKEGKKHREGDLPASIWADGSQFWYKEGEYHREGDLPAIIRTNGSQEWYKEGKWHREGGLPAIIWADGSQEWFKEGLLHRELGPATGDKYFLENVGYNRDEWLLIVTRSQRVILAEWWEERRRWRNDLPKRTGNEFLEMLGKLPRACLAEVLMQISPVRK